MNITIVFPPVADPSLPYCSLPLLGAVLRQAGYQDVILRDLNLESFDALFQPDVLNDTIRLCHNILKEINIHTNTVTWKVQSALTIADEVIENVATARHILRNPIEFYEPQKLLFAKRIFHLSGVLLSAPFPNIHFNKYSYSMSSYDSFEAIRQAVLMDGGPLPNYFRNIAVPSLLSHSPTIIGISVPYFSQLIPAFMLAEVIREQDSDVHITFGGPVITWGKEVLASDYRFSRWIDSFFIGEAEETFLEFVESFNGRLPISQVRNIVRYKDNHIIDQFDPTYELNMDWIPTPDYTMLPMQQYFAPKRIICMTLTRGCYYNKCAFCNYAFIKIAPYRLRSPKLIAQDIVRIQETTHEDVFCFESDVILPRHLKEISEAIIERGINIKWHGVARFERGMTQDMFDLMRRSGCIRLYMGLDSTNERVLKAMDKGTTPQRMAEILEMCSKSGISVEAGVFSNFPSETIGEAEETYRFIQKHRNVITRADVGSFRLLKGAPIAKNPDEFGITVLGEPNDRWYHLEYLDPTPRTLPEGVLSAMEKVQQLYPEVILIDVPEDILYIAEKGPNVFRKLFGYENLMRDMHPCHLTDTSTVFIAPEFDLHRVRVTNAGSIYFGDIDDEMKYTNPLFEWSQTSIIIALNRRNLSLHPLTPIEARIVSKVRKARSTALQIREDFKHYIRHDKSDFDQNEIINIWDVSINRLINIGLLQFDVEK